jgi:subfamily B ATP-binding cassette protein MsbA
MLKKQNRLSTIFLYVKLLKKWGYKQKKFFFIANIFMVIVAGATSMYPLIIDFAFDVISEKNREYIFLLPLFILGITITKGLAHYFQTLYVGIIANSIIKDIQYNLYAKVLDFDVTIFNQHNAGSLQSRFMNDLNILKESVIRTLNNLIRDFLTLIGLILSMFYLDWVLTLCVILVYPLCIRPVINIGKNTRAISLKLQKKISNAGAFLGESFSAIRVIKTYNLENIQKKIAKKKFEEIFEGNIKIIKTRAKIEPTLEIIGGIAISIVLVIAGMRILNNNSDLGSFTGFISALLIAVQPARALGTLNTILQEGAASLLRLEELLNKQSLLETSNSKITLKLLEGRISFKNVSFYYDYKNYILKNVNCNIYPGEKVVVVGANGSGKSTFVNLIPRLMDPIRGNIHIEGNNIKRYNLKSLRSNIALVSQDVILFDTSILKNISIANTKATTSEIIEACKKADAHSFISKLKKSYNTITGDRGLNLSGGERQKISIARALVKKPKILLLDEATSALDNKSEYKVNKVLKGLKNVTIITIAHRLSTILDASRILYFENGKIIADGKHKVLLKSNSKYKNHFFSVFKE